MLRPFQIVCLLVFSLTVALSQAQAPAPAPAVITFAFDFPTSEPEHYSIRLQSDGVARYHSSGRLSGESNGRDSQDTASHESDSGNPDSNSSNNNNDSFDLDFTVTAETRQKIFDLAAKAGYFKKDLASQHKGMAFTGQKTLTYKDAQRNGESTYIYSTIPAVQELTGMLQRLSSTLEFGHRLQYDRHYQKLALDEELRRMEEMSISNQLLEITAIQPILDQIIADPSVINVTRARAQRLLDKAASH
jgi:hypothetical protein